VWCAFCFLYRVDSCECERIPLDTAICSSEVCSVCVFRSTLFVLSIRSLTRLCYLLYIYILKHICRPPKVQKSKAQKALAASSGSKGKGKKKRWTKTKIADKRNHAVVINKGAFDKIAKEIYSKKVITVYNLIEQYKINGSIARAVMKECAKNGKIVPVIENAAMSIYTGVSFSFSSSYQHS